MNKKPVITVLVLISGMTLCFWSMSLIFPGEASNTLRNPGMLIAGIFMLAVGLKNSLLGLFAPLLRKSPQLHQRLNLDLWTFLLGPDKKDKS